MRSSTTAHRTKRVVMCPNYATGRTAVSALVLR